MGSAVGEGVTRAAELALEQRTPLLVVCASGGARMQEGCVSLMQMAKTSAGVRAAARGGRARRSACSPTRPTAASAPRSRRSATSCSPSRSSLHRLRRPEGDRADDPPAAARGLPDRRVPARPRACSTWSSRARTSQDVLRKLLELHTLQRAAGCPRPRAPSRSPIPTRCRSAPPGTSSSSRATSSGRTRSSTSATSSTTSRSSTATGSSTRTRRSSAASARLGDLAVVVDRPPEGPHDERDDGAELRHAEPRGLPQGHAPDASTRRGSACRSSPSSTRRAPIRASAPRSAASRSRSPESIMKMSRLPVPAVTLVTGEGGSGRRARARGRRPGADDGELVLLGDQPRGLLDDPVQGRGAGAARGRGAAPDRRRPAAARDHGRGRPRARGRRPHRPAGRGGRTSRRRSSAALRELRRDARRAAAREPLRALPQVRRSRRQPTLPPIEESE